MEQVGPLLMFGFSVAFTMAPAFLRGEADQKVGGRRRDKIDIDDASLSIAKRKNLAARRKSVSVHAEKWNKLSSAEKAATRKQILEDKVQVEERLEWAKQHGLKVCVDFAYDADHSDIELRSLARQLSTSYSIMKQSEQPINLILTSLDVDKNKESITALERYGLKNWKVDRHASSPAIAFPTQNVVYLSPDAEEVLTHIDRDTVYVYGSWFYLLLHGFT